MEEKEVQLISHVRDALALSLSTTVSIDSFRAGDFVVDRHDVLAALRDLNDPALAGGAVTNIASALASDVTANALSNIRVSS